MIPIIYTLLAWWNPAYADEIQNPLHAQSFAQLVQDFTRLLTQIGIPLATIFIIYSGFLFVSARGSDEQIKKAKSTFFWTLIGTAVLVGAYAIASAVVNFAQQL